MLHWDAAAMMPPGGAAARAEQLATLRCIAHQMLTAPEIGDLLAAAEGEATRSASGSAPICARCGGAGGMRRRCRPISSRRCRAPARESRDGMAQARAGE